MQPPFGMQDTEASSIWNIRIWNREAVKFEFYAVLLIEECTDGCYCCGRKYYDYSNATMVFLIANGLRFIFTCSLSLRSLSLFIMLHIRILIHTYV